jgi:hypothetical protein
MCSTLVLAAACQDAHVRGRESPARGKPWSCEEHIPPDSSGPRPAGTTSDPFIGYAVIRRKNDATADLVEVLARQRAIPYLRTATEWWFHVRREVAANVAEGDFVRLKFAKIPEHADLVVRALAAERTGVATGPMPFVYCGYELFAMEKVPDAEFPR